MVIAKAFQTGAFVGLVRPFELRRVTPGRRLTGIPDRTSDDTVVFTWGKSPTQIEVVQNQWQLSIRKYMTKRQVEEETDEEEFVEGEGEGG